MQSKRLNQASVDDARTQAMLAALARPDAYPHAAPTVARVDTHISWVFLAGEFAYKLKKPVNFGFLDFSTLERRHVLCQEELRLNRRFSPELYLEVVPVTCREGRYAFGGDGEIVEYAVKMRRFADDARLDRVARRGGLTHALLDAMCDQIAAAHRAAASATADSEYGLPRGIHHWFTENFDHIRPRLSQAADRMAVERIARWGETAFERLRATLDARRRDGFVRECHGDLHLGNLVEVGDRVRLFDCIEFNPELRWIDVMSDVAFLYMDLLDQGLQGAARRFLNRYLQATGDYAGLVVMPYYFVYRALVRAKVAVLRLSREGDTAGDASARDECRSYLALAERLINRARGQLMITHGLSGSGKSTLAAQLVERTGAVQIRSDVERKRLFGFDALAVTGSVVDAGLYGPDAGRRTYERLAEAARAALAGGFSAIVDATFLAGAQREAFAALAAAADTDFLILDFKAPESELRARVGARLRAGGDASEADQAVLEAQLRRAEPLTGAERASCVAFDTTDAAAVERGCRNVEERLAS